MAAGPGGRTQLFISVIDDYDIVLQSDPVVYRISCRHGHSGSRRVRLILKICLMRKTKNEKMLRVSNNRHFGVDFSNGRTVDARR